jgi:choline dehydrogenase-like flavoprotein
LDDLFYLGMVYFRGHPKDYDNWEKLGAKGWSWNDVLPYFLRLEGSQDPRYANSSYHNTSGPFILSSNSYYSPELVSNYTVNACKELGFDEIDLYGPTRVGTGYPQQNIDSRDGTRVSTSKAYLEPFIDKRPNLHVLANSYVTKVLISDTKKAFGVEYRRNNQTFTVNATKEVILSAGAIKSPQILLLSGIGPKQQLAKFNISMVAELSGVGQNLMDHPYLYGTGFRVTKLGNN